MSVSSGSMSIGVLAILTGLVGSYAFRALLMNEPPPPPVKEPAQVVPMATADLPANRVILLGDVGLAQMTQQQIIERKFPSGYMQNPQQIIGRTLKEGIKQGQPFLPTKLYLQGEGADPVAKLRQGYRAYTLVVPEGIAATMAPDTYVDILFTTNPRPAKNGQLAIPEVTMPLLQGVEVLNVRIPPREEKKESNVLDIRRYDGALAVAASTVTFAVTPEQAMKLETVSGLGRFFFSRRPKEEGYVANSKEQHMNVYELLGLKPEEPPQPATPPWITEQYNRGSVRQVPYDRQRLAYEMWMAQQRDKGAPVPQPGLGPQGPGAGQPAADDGANTNNGATGAKATGAPQAAPLGGGNNPVDRLNNLKSNTDPFGESAKNHP